MSQENTKILLVEDDSNLGWVLQESLELKKYNVVHCKNGEEGLDAFQRNAFDICIFDVMMPKMDGFTLAKEVRRVDKEVPILFLTAKSMKEDKIEGFKIGGDDYVTKPFSMEELELRIKAILRRTMPIEEEEQEYDLGKFHFNYKLQLLKEENGEEKKLTTKESELLRLLCQYKNNVLEREIALKRIWGNDSYFTARSMDVFITKLRKYLKSDPDIEIVNVHGTGYKLIA